MSEEGRTLRGRAMVPVERTIEVRVPVRRGDSDPRLAFIFTIPERRIRL